MAFDPPQRVFYQSLYDVYEAVHLNRRLAGVAKAFGKKQGQALAVTPRILWLPAAADRFRPAEMGGEVAVMAGPGGANQLVEIEEFDRRDGAAVVQLYADTYRDLELLVIRFRGALADVLRADRMYEATTGSIIEPETDTDNTWIYRMPLAVRLLCADLYPVTSPTDFQGELGSTQ